MAENSVFVAEVPNLGPYLVYVAQPTHVSISSFEDKTPREWARLKYPATYVESEPFETTCRRAVAQSLALGIIGEGPHEFIETSLDLKIEPWRGTLVPQAV